MKKYFEVEKCTHHTTEILVNASENMSVEIVPVGCKMSHLYCCISKTTTNIYWAF